MNQQTKFKRLLCSTECTCTTLWGPDSYLDFEVGAGCSLTSSEDCRAPDSQPTWWLKKHLV